MNQDDTGLPITYRDFYDVPRMILVEYEGAFYLFDCPFNDEMDDYPSAFTVYRLEPAQGRRALESRAWVGLAEKGKEVGQVSVEDVHLDSSKRRSLAASVFSLLVE
jgi:hypothetical protein